MACVFIGEILDERMAHIPVSVELASEFRYREPVIRPGAVVIGVSNRVKPQIPWLF